MKVLSVVGARPQFIKLAPVSAAFETTDHEHRIVHTGQHYDADMSEVFFDGLSIPAPDWNLGIGSGPQGAQTGAMLAGVETVLADERPDWVLVYGDTNSTLAAALAAVKLHLPVAHLEAGLRSFNRRMPEEHNRVLTDHAADLLLAPTETAAAHLDREGLGDRCVVVGDVMIDVLLLVAAKVQSAPLPVGVPDDRAPFILATVHRAENTDDPRRLRRVIAALAGLPHAVVLPAHPRLVQRAEAAGIALDAGALIPVEPLAYDAMVRTMQGACAVVTDSGGLQKEAFALGVPTTTIRDETEWVETLDDGWNVICRDLDSLSDAVLRPVPTGPRAHPFGTGDAAELVVRALSK